jgi:hypothetical protein
LTLLMPIVPMPSKLGLKPMTPPIDWPKTRLYPHRVQTRLITANITNHCTIVDTRFFLRTRPP